MVLAANIIHRLIQLFILFIIVQTMLSYFMSPFDPVRMKIDRLVEPFYQPIRRLLPKTGMFDFSPLVLVIALYILDYLITQVLLSFAY
jgi:YggT family protein